MKVYRDNRIYTIPDIRPKKDILDLMRPKYELRLNPKRYKLNAPVLARLKLIDALEVTYAGNVSKASKKLCISRQWLSTLYNHFLKANRDPRCLTLGSRAPQNTSNRKRISPEVEDLILAVRKKYPTWGNEKLQRVLKRDHHVTIGHTTINRYLDKHKLLNVTISQKNKRAWKNTILSKRIKARPPKLLKDYKPGALVEKDMKFIVKQGSLRNRGKTKAKENFFFQHTAIDDFTRVRVLELVRDAQAQTAARAHERARKRFPFSIACVNTDNGSENGAAMQEYFTAHNIIQFYSNTGTPTDNPRVERSHLTDENEFYAVDGNRFKDFVPLKSSMKKWEHVYNYLRPHQALGYLTPMEFYVLWKQDPTAAYRIKDKWQAYLRAQSKRQYQARRIKKKQKITALMEHIDALIQQKK